MRKLQGQTVSGMIVPHTTKDKYPTHSSEYGKGGHKEVTTLQDRDDIPEERLIDGTICYVKETDKEYQYKNKKWVEYTNFNKEVIIQESDKLQQEINKLKDSKQDKGDYVVNSTLNQYAKKSDIPDIISQDLSNYAKKSDIPDTSNFAKKSDIPQEQDLSNYAKKSDIPDVSQFAKKSDIPQGQDLSKYATKEYVDSKTFSGGGKNYEVTDFSVTGNELHIKQNNGINKSVTLPTTGGSTPGKDGIDGDGIEQVYLNSNTSSLQGSILNYTFGYVNGDHSTQKILRDYAPITDNYVPEQCTNYVVKPTVDLQYVYVSQRKKIFAEGSTTKKVWGEFEPLRLLYVYTKAEIDPSLVEQAIKSALEESAKLDEIIRQKLLDQFGIDKEALQKALQQIKDGQTELNNVQAEINKLKGKVDVNASSIDTLTNTVKNVGINLDAVKAQLTQYVTSSDIDDKVAKAVRTTLDGLEPSWTTIVAELWPDKDLSKASQLKINSDSISALTERTTENETAIAALKAHTGDKSAAAELVAAVSDKKTGKVTAASIIAAVNNSSSEVTLKADKIQLDGETIAKYIKAIDLTLTGNITATNMDIQGGTIGGFTIGKDYIGVKADKNEEGSGNWANLTMSKDFFKVGGNDGYAMFGNNVMPASSGEAFNATSRIVNNTINKDNGLFDSANFGLYVDVTGGTKNYALYSNNGVVRAPAVYGDRIQGLGLYSDTSTYTLDFSKGNVIIIDNLTNKTIRLQLPSENTIASQFGYSELPTDFGVLVTMILVYGSEVWINPITDQNNNIVNDFKLGAGDSITILISKLLSGTLVYKLVNYMN